MPTLRQQTRRSRSPRGGFPQEPAKSTTLTTAPLDCLIPAIRRIASSYSFSTMSRKPTIMATVPPSQCLYDAAAKFTRSRYTCSESCMNRTPHASSSGTVSERFHFTSALCGITKSASIHIPRLAWFTLLRDTPSFRTLKESISMASFLTTTAFSTSSSSLQPNELHHSRNQLPHVADSRSSIRQDHHSRLAALPPRVSCGSRRPNPYHPSPVHLNVSEYSENAVNSPPNLNGVLSSRHSPSISTAKRTSNSALSTPPLCPQRFAPSHGPPRELVADDVRETIWHLEQIAKELRAMDTDRPAVPTLDRPPLQMMITPLSRPQSPSASSVNMSDSSCDSGRSLSSLESFHAPILNGQHSLAFLHNEVSQQSMSAGIAFGMKIPRIMVTVPSSEQLLECAQSYGNEGHADQSDEVKWLEEYGQWDNPAEGSWKDMHSTDDDDDNDSDASSFASSLFITVPDSSSISSSPPLSPTSPPNSPPAYEHHRSHKFLSDRSSPASQRHVSPPLYEDLYSVPSSPALWLCHIVSKPFLEHKYRRMQKLRKAPPTTRARTFSSPTPPPPRSSSRHWAAAEDPFAMQPLLRHQSATSPTTSTSAFAMRPPAGSFVQQENVSSWSVGTESLELRRRGWSSSLGRFFKKTK